MLYFTTFMTTNWENQKLTGRHHWIQLKKIQYSDFSLCIGARERNGKQYAMFWCGLTLITCGIYTLFLFKNKTVHTINLKQAEVTLGFLHHIAVRILETGDVARGIGGRSRGIRWNDGNRIDHHNQYRNHQHGDATDDRPVHDCEYASDDDIEGARQSRTVLLCTTGKLPNFFSQSCLVFLRQTVCGQTNQTLLQMPARNLAHRLPNLSIQ